MLNTNLGNVTELKDALLQSFLWRTKGSPVRSLYAIFHVSKNGQILILDDTGNPAILIWSTQNKEKTLSHFGVFGTVPDVLHRLRKGKPNSQMRRHISIITDCRITHMAVTTLGTIPCVLEE